MGRHGSRWPLSSELPYIQNLTLKLAGAAEYIAKARLPESMEFLKDGYTTSLGINNLTAPGRKQLFEHGVDFRLKYPQLTATNVLAGNQDRVPWAFFGRYWTTGDLNLINEDSVTISWITPMNTCPLWQYCIWAERVSPWCAVFTESEILDFEYELDLLMDSAFGYNLPSPMGPTLGTLFVNKLVERFTNSTGDAQEMYMEFGHDTTIDLALTALGLAKDKKPLPSKGPVPANRAFRTSTQVPFAAQMSHFDKTYGSCSLDAFVKANSFSTSITWGDAAWNATCGPLH
ncbi:histidine phosphatase superfamily [Mycena amicta]|nr:histidine phosphatase superfamily [Mycena amicta]